MKLVVATTNNGKLKEIATRLETYGVEILSITDFPDMPSIAENGDTFVDNALIKARSVAAFTGLAALADDSGLEVDSLGGAPGVLSARFAPTDRERNARLLESMKDISDSNRTARFVCALAFVRPDGFEWTTEGVCEGVITREPSGSNGFGYDPVFFYPPMGVTFAELTKEEKNRVSHRGKALDMFAKAARERSFFA